MQFQVGKTRVAGFTLIELLTAVALVAILAAMAFPSFRSLIANSEARSIAYDLMADLSTARMEAVRRGVPIEVVSANGSDDWSSGWSISADTANDGTFATTLREHAKVVHSFKATAEADTPKAGVGAERVRFDSQGTLATASAFAIHVCHVGTAQYGRTVAVQATGRVSIALPGPGQTPAHC